VLTKPDAIKLAAALLDYVQHGTTSAVGCVSQCDVEDYLDRSRNGQPLMIPTDRADLGW
jgi:hypothetical protein